MNGATLAAALLCAALWVAFPDPRVQLRRLGTQTGPATWRLAPLVVGRAGSPRQRTRVLAGITAAAAILAWQPTAVGAAWGVVAAVVVVGAGGWVVLPGRGPDAKQAGLADAVELLAVCLEAGRAMGEALAVVAGVSGTATASVLGRVLGQLRLGVPEQQAWCELADDEVWGPVARDVARSARSGTSLVEVLHVHADEARLAGQEVALQRARTAGVRSVVPLMACFLPAFILVGVVPIIAGLLERLLSP
ncbi:MAG: type II secretion system F family protein [Arachnia sp.]